MQGMGCDILIDVYNHVLNAVKIKVWIKKRDIGV